MSLLRPVDGVSAVIASYIARQVSLTPFVHDVARELKVEVVDASPVKEPPMPTFNR